MKISDNLAPAAVPCAETSAPLPDADALEVFEKALHESNYEKDVSADDQRRPLTKGLHAGQKDASIHERSEHIAKLFASAEKETASLNCASSSNAPKESRTQNSENAEQREASSSNAPKESRTQNSENAEQREASSFKEGKDSSLGSNNELGLEMESEPHWGATQKSAPHMTPFAPPPLPNPESLLQGLFTQSAPASVQGAPQVSAYAPSNELTMQMVERILVSEPTAQGQEVRITLGEGALKGSEISMIKNVDGQLVVQINCAGAAAFQTAVQARESLEQALINLGEQVQVHVDEQDRHEERNQRSRTYVAYEPEQL